MLLFLLLLCAREGSAQTQDMLRKAKAMGFSEEMIRSQMKGAGGTTVGKETAGKGGTGNTNALTPWDEADPFDRERKKLEELLEQQERRKNMRDSLDKVVFGREIFSFKNLSFEPDYNMATPVDYRLGPNDEVIVDVWGDSEANYRQKISPDGTIYIENAGLIPLAGLTVEEAEKRLKARLSDIYAGLEDRSHNVEIKVSLGQIRSIKVNIVGEVQVPGTYTLPSLASVFNALYAAGGVNDIGTLRDIRIYRGNRQVARLDVYDYLLNGKYDANVRLQDNDMVIVGAYGNLVNVTGKVKRDRIYELRKGESLQDLLKYAGGFTGDAYTENIQVNRKNGSRYQIFTVSRDNFPGFVMQDGDSLHVGGSIQMYENRVAIRGAVWRPGNYELGRETATVVSLLRKAEGLKGDAFTHRGQITRLRPDFTYEIIPIDIRAMLRGEAPDIALQPEDEVYIPSVYDLRENQYIIVRGEVNKAVAPDKEPVPADLSGIDLSVVSSAKAVKDALKKLGENGRPAYGEHLDFDYTSVAAPEVKRVTSDTIPFKENMTIEDAILLAGGLKESASEAKVLVARRVKDPASTSFTNRIAEEYEFNISRDLKLDPAASGFVLMPFDEVYVRRSPGYQEQQIVAVQGEVLFPGDYVLAARNEKLADLVRKAGGVTPEAYVRGAHLKRMKTVSDIAREETLFRIAQSASGAGRDSLSYTQLKTDSMVVVGIDLERALEFPDSEFNIPLKEGDILMVPQRSNTVKINGAVLYPTTATYKKKARLRDYIFQAGGYVQKARRRPYVIYMNGQVAATRNGFFCKRYPRIEPGAEIVVPMKVPNPNRLGLAEILSMANSATSMAAMITSISNSTK